MKQSLKVDFYDNFKCAAERCSFCCCRGWDISVDTDTRNKWEQDKEQKQQIIKNLLIKKRRKKEEAFIRMDSDKGCPFLNSDGLCGIYLNYGEDYQPKTCRLFPRIENGMGNFMEYSLSCACPEVVDNINNRDGRINFLFDGNDNLLDQAPLEFVIRKCMISILENSDFSLQDRLLLIFYMLLSIRTENTEALSSISKFQNMNYLKDLAGSWCKIEISAEDKFQETNELFLDIAANYHKEKAYKNYLKKIYEAAEEMDNPNRVTLNLWKKFFKEFENCSKLLGNCMITKIFANCNSGNIDELILSFQVIVTQYLMIRHSAFLNCFIRRLDGKDNIAASSSDKMQLNYTDLRNYIVIYSRIIEYNPEGIKEFWKESFDEAIWEFGYMLLLN